MSYLNHAMLRAVPRLMAGATLILLLPTGCVRAGGNALTKDEDSSLTIDSLAAAVDPKLVDAPLTTPLLMAWGDAVTSQPYGLVYMAALGNDRPTLRALRRRTANLDALNTQTLETALHSLVLEGQLAPARLLLEEGCDPNLYRGGGTTALMDAIGLERHDMIAALLEHGASPEMPELVLGFYPLHNAATIGDTTATAMLIKAGADLEVKSPAGVRPLHLAVNSGSVACVKQLLEAGADPAAATNVGRTPLMVAHDLERKDIEDVLQEALLGRAAINQ